MAGIFDKRFIRVYLMPGAVFQSVMVGGGYGTGREVVEYFSPFGAAGGVLAILVAWAALAVVLATTFEYARRIGAYDYRSFFVHLLGRAWFVFEILVIVLFLLVLAVLASAAGNILRDHFGVPYFVGLVVMLTLIGVLTFYGRALIEKVLTLWSVFLYAVFIAFFIAVFSRDGADLSSVFDIAATQPGWQVSGLQYALYNLAGAPLLLYVVRALGSTKEATLAGVIAATLAMLPALLFHIAFLTQWPAVLDENIPVYWMMSGLGIAPLLIAFTVMLFGTFIETGAGLLQGINERIDGYLLERRLPSLRPAKRAAIAVSAIVVSALLSLWGITNLIAQGYGMMAWAFLAIYVVPLLSIGLYRLFSGSADMRVNQ